MNRCNTLFVVVALLMLQPMLRGVKGRPLGKVLVVWDGAPIHRSTVVKEYLCTEGKGQVHLERLPAYVREVNPDEGGVT